MLLLWQKVADTLSKQISAAKSFARHTVVGTEENLLEKWENHSFGTALFSVFFALSLIFLHVVPVFAMSHSFPRSRNHISTQSLITSLNSQMQYPSHHSSLFIGLLSPPINDLPHRTQARVTQPCNLASNMTYSTTYLSVFRVPPTRKQKSATPNQKLA